MTTTFHQGNPRPKSGHKVGAEILKTIAGLGQVGANAYLDKQERDIEEKKYGNISGDGEQKPKGDRIQWNYEDLVDNGQRHFEKAKHYTRVGNKDQAKIERELGDRLSKEASQLLKANTQNQKENRKIFETGKQAGLTYKALGQLTEKMSKEKKTGEFFDRLGKNLKMTEDGITFGKLGKLFSTPDEEKYVKYVNSLLSGAKAQFGSRVTNFDIQAFLSQHPNLWQSESGRKDIIDTLKIMNDLNTTHAELKDKAYADTKGMINPHVIDQKIDEFMAPQIEEAMRLLEEVVGRTEGRSEQKQSQVQPPEGAEEVKTINGKHYARIGKQWFEYEE